MIDIWCSENICPICNSKMIEESSSNVYCKNKCYAIVGTWGAVDIQVFGKNFLFILREFEDELEDERDILESEKISELVQYWKENERYLIKLMEK
ncbi:hypothetical protein D3C87_76710 [compost metagenome]